MQTNAMSWVVPPASTAAQEKQDALASSSRASDSWMGRRLAGSLRKGTLSTTLWQHETSTPKPSSRTGWLVLLASGNYASLNRSRTEPVNEATTAVSEGRGSAFPRQRPVALSQLSTLLLACVLFCQNLSGCSAVPMTKSGPSKH